MDECHLLFVPVRESGSGVLALRTGRLPSGQRVGLAYTSAAALLSALGQGQPWIRLHEDAMRDMLEPAGIDQIRVDACPSAPPRPPRPPRPGSAAGPTHPGRLVSPSRTSVQPRRCHIAVVRTTTLSHCRGCGRRPAGLLLINYALSAVSGVIAPETADKSLAWPGPGRLPVPRAPAPHPGVLAGARK
jgi:hypothetical protein